MLDRTERVLIGAASLALGLGGLAALWLLARPLALLLAAIVVANALEPLVARLGRWMPRAVAVAALYLMMLGALGLLGWLVIPDLVAQGRELLARGPELIEQGRQLLERSVPAQAGGASVQSTISEQAGQAITVPFTVASGLLDLVLVLALAAYWLVDLPRLRRFALSLVPAARAAEASDVLREIGQSMGGYVRGTAINAAIVGTAVTIGMLVIGLPYPVLFGLLAALGEPFPYVGPLAAAIPAVLVALVQSPTQALIVLAFYLVVQLVEGYLLFPLVVGEQADVSPILVIVALLAGGALGGLLGALVAVPAVAALQVIVRRLLVPALRRRIGGSEGVAERTDVAMHPAEAGERG